MQRILPIISLFFLSQFFILPDLAAQAPLSSDTAATTNLNELGKLDFDWEVFPNPTTAGRSLQIAIASSENTQAQISIYNAQGQRLWSQSPRIAQGRDQATSPNSCKLASWTLFCRNERSPWN